MTKKLLILLVLLLIVAAGITFAAIGVVLPAIASAASNRQPRE